MRGRMSSSTALEGPPVSTLLTVSLAFTLVFIMAAGTFAITDAEAGQELAARHILSVPCRGGEYFDFTPLGLAFDASGRLYIVDADDSRIMMLRDSFEDMRPFSEYFRDSVGVHFVDVEVRDGLTVYVSEENSGRLIGFDRMGQPRAARYVGEGVAGFGIGSGGKACVANPVYELIRIVYIDGDRETADVTMEPEAGHVLYVDCLLVARGRFVATAANMDLLLEFNAVGNYMGPFSRHKFSEPYGIASLRDEYVLVSDVGEKEVVVLDMRGRRIGSFGHGILEEPAFLAVRTDGTVCVSDTRRRSIEVFKIEID